MRECRGKTRGDSASRADNPRPTRRQRWQNSRHSLRGSCANDIWDGNRFAWFAQRYRIFRRNGHPALSARASKSSDPGRQACGLARLASGPLDSTSMSTITRARIAGPKTSDAMSSAILDLYMRIAEHGVTSLLLALCLGMPCSSAEDRTVEKAACRDPVHRQFDFWLGDWDVFDAEGPKSAHVLVESILDGCVLQETYEGANGANGKSFTIYDA